MDEGTLGIHEIELVINAAECLGNCGGVGNHANGTLDTCKISSRNNRGWLVVDSTLEARGAPGVREREKRQHVSVINLKSQL